MHCCRRRARRGASPGGRAILQRSPTCIAPPCTRARTHLCSSPRPHARTHGRTCSVLLARRRRPRCCEPAGVWLGANLKRDSWYCYYDAVQSIQGLSSLIAATSCRRLHAQASEVWGHHGEHAACLDHARALDGPEDVVYAPPVRCASARARACVRACMHGQAGAAWQSEARSLLNRSQYGRCGSCMAVRVGCSPCLHAA
jgi:hypothetical protein